MFPQNTPQQTCRENLDIIYKHHTDRGGLGDINAGYCHTFSNFILSMSNPQFIQNIREFKKTLYYSQMQTLLQQPNFDAINSADCCWDLYKAVNAYAPQLSVLLSMLYGNDYLNPTTSLQYSNHNKRNNVMQVLKFIKLICDGTDKDGKITNPDSLSKGLQQFIEDNGGNSYRYYDNYNYMMAFFSHCALIMGCGDFGKVPYRTVYKDCGKQLENLQGQQLGDIHSSFNNGDSFLSLAGGNHQYVCYKNNGKYYAIGHPQPQFDKAEKALQAWVTEDNIDTDQKGTRIIISNKLLTNRTKLSNTADTCELLIELLKSFKYAFNENGDKDSHENTMKKDHMWRGIPSLNGNILNNIYSAMYALAKKRAFADDLDEFDRSFIQNVDDICRNGINAGFIKNKINNLLQNNMVMNNPMMNNMGNNVQNPMMNNMGNNNMNNQMGMNMGNNNMNNPMGMNPQFMPPNNMKNQMGMNIGMNNMGNNNMGMNNNINVNNINNNMNNQINQNGMNNMNNPMMNNIGMNMGNNIMNNQMGMNNPMMNGNYNNNNIHITNNISNKYDEVVSTTKMNNSPEHLFGLSCLPEISKDTSDCGELFYWKPCC